MKLSKFPSCSVLPILCTAILPSILPATITACQSRTSDSAIYIIGYGQDEPPNMQLPFWDEDFWYLSRGYETETHRDNGFEYGDDRYALDFTKPDCEAYGAWITAIADGRVMQLTLAADQPTANEEGYGYTLLIEHENSYVSRYAHLAGSNVEEDEWLVQGQIIGAVGNTGNATGGNCQEHPGTHLHLALYWEGEGVRPIPMSGLYRFEEDCWYRAIKATASSEAYGEKDCSRNPGEY